ncbi:hypothetical protein [Aliidiomarina indica]|uniref:hypothetical protein n=1 Tax=Aliidiomarina indica TaxID=2749147 RepID=UPI00188E6A99|nr:hypothetical protein [Aliidiomarina indica]
MIKTYIRGVFLAASCAFLLACSGDPEIILPDGGTVADAVSEIESRASGLSYAEVLSTPQRHPLALARYIAEHGNDNGMLFTVYTQLIQILSTHNVPQEAVIDVLLQAQWHLENTTHPEFFDPFRFELTIIEGYIDIGLVEEGMMRLRDLDQRLSEQLLTPTVLNARYQRSELVRKAKDVEFLEELVDRQADPAIRAQWRAYLGLLYLDKGEELMARRVADDIAFRLGELRWTEMPLEVDNESYQIRMAYEALFELFAALGDQRNALEVLDMSYTRVQAENGDNPYWQLAGRISYIDDFASINEMARAQQVAIQIVFDLESFLESTDDYAYYFIFSGLEELIDVLMKFDMQEQQSQLVQLISGMIMAEDDPEMLWYALLVVELMKSFEQEGNYTDMLHHIRFLTNQLTSIDERLMIYSWKLDLYADLGMNRDAERMLSLLAAELDRSHAEDVRELFAFIGERLLNHDRKDLYDRHIVPAVEGAPYLIHNVGYTLAEYEYYEDALALILGRDNLDMVPYFLLSIGQLYVSKQRIPIQSERDVLEVLHKETQALLTVSDSEAAY